MDEEKKTVKDTEGEKVDQKAIIDGAVDKIVEAVMKGMASKEEAKPETIAEIKTKIYSDGNLREVSFPSDVKSLEKNEKIVAFLKALPYARFNPEAGNVMKALVEGTTTEGGYLVPEELRAEVWRILPDFAVMRKVARVIPMSTSTLKLNSLSAKPVAYWTAEYASKATGSAEFAQTTLSVNDLVCLLPISEQLLADANIGVIGFITQLFAEAIAGGEDKAFFTGSGTGQPKGINQESITSVNAGNAGTFDHIIALIHSLPQAVRRSRNTAFVAHQYAIRLLRTLKDSDGRYIWQAGDPNNPNSPDRLYGYPLYEQNDIAQTEIYFGDWSNYVIGDRQQMVVSTTTEGGEAWRRNAVEIKAVSRVDGATVLTSAFAKITNWK